MEGGAGQSILQCYRKFLQPPPWSHERYKGIQIGMGQVLHGPRPRELDKSCKYANWWLEQTKEWEGYRNRILASLWDICAKKLGKYCWEWLALVADKMELKVELLVEENCHKTSQGILMATSSKTSHGGASLSSNVQLPSMRTCSLYSFNVQLDNGGGSSFLCPLLDWPVGRRSNYTCH